MGIPEYKESKTTKLSWEEWDKLSEPYYLTIQDIRSMRPGARVELLIQDRNIGDSVDHHFDGFARKPEEFFCGLKDVFIKGENGLEGIMKWHWGETQSFKFELLCEEKKIWCPLDGDYHPPSEKNWQDLPTTTYVGWRGH